MTTKETATMLLAILLMGGVAAYFILNGSSKSKSGINIMLSNDSNSTSGTKQDSDNDNSTNSWNGDIGDGNSWG